MCVRITLSQCLAAKGTDEVSRWNGALGACCISSFDDLWLPRLWTPSPLQLRSPPWTPGASPVGAPCHVVPPGSHGCPVVVSWQIQKREQTRLIPYPVKSYFTTLRECISLLQSISFFGYYHCQRLIVILHCYYIEKVRTKWPVKFFLFSWFLLATTITDLIA